MAKISPIQFFRQVKQEVKKVTWPTRKEVVRTSIMVIVLVAIAATFFFFVDQIFGWVVKLIFGLGAVCTLVCSSCLLRFGEKGSRID